MASKRKDRRRRRAQAERVRDIIIIPGQTEMEALAAASRWRQGAATPAAGKLAPTPEQIAHGGFGDGPVPVKTDKGHPVGHAYRRHPIFETLAKTMTKKGADGRPARVIGHDELAALRYYRGAHDNSETSEVRSCLNVGEGGGGGGARLPSEPSLHVVAARRRVALCEAGIAKGLLHTLRSVALEDLTFTDLAKLRYGSRVQRWIVQGVEVEKVVALSNSHRANVSDEFVQAVRALTANVRPLIATAA